MNLQRTVHAAMFVVGAFLATNVIAGVQPSSEEYLQLLNRLGDCQTEWDNARAVSDRLARVEFDDESGSFTLFFSRGGSPRSEPIITGVLTIAERRGPDADHTECALSVSKTSVLNGG